MITSISSKPASTVVLWAENAKDPEVLMLKRQTQRGILKGAHVFPGGCVDDADLQHAADMPVDLKEFALSRLPQCENEVIALAYFVAASRETAEERG